jgi:hypothetical protein
MLRSRDGDQRVTNIELFFDLVYVFAVTQLSHGLLNHLTVEGALQTALLLGMVWLVWAYTTWVTNWLDPDRTPTRLMLIALMLASLVMSTGLPDAFGDRGLAVGGAYAAMQIGRSAYTVIALRGERLQRNYQRILAWCVVSGALAVAGGFADERWREVLWLTAILVDFIGGWVGFYTPGLGRSVTQDWTIEGGHFAERCQAFMLIALGESIEEAKRLAHQGRFTELAKLAEPHHEKLERAGSADRPRNQTEEQFLSGYINRLGRISTELAALHANWPEALASVESRLAALGEATRRADQVREHAPDEHAVALHADGLRGRREAQAASRPPSACAAATGTGRGRARRARARAARAGAASTRR